MSVIDDKARELGALMDAADLQVQLTAATQRADAAQSALALATNSTPGRGTGVWVPLDKWTELQAQLARKDLDAVHVAAATFENLRPDIDRYGADQWRNGNAGREPQEWDEWRRK